MKKFAILTLSALSISLLGAADSLEGMFKDGKVSGQIRAYHISRDVTTSSTNYIRKATALGGHLKFQTASLNGVSLGVAGYTTNGVLLRSNKTDYTRVDPTLLGKDNDAYSILGEAYVQYVTGKTTFKAGRQTLKTPLAGTDDARMLPNLFEAYLLINGDIKDTTLIAAHVTKFAQGTFGRAYNGGVLSVTGGYSFTDSRSRVGEFVNMGEYAVGENTSGVTAAAIIYSGIDGVKLQAWDYYAHDILNAIYLQADASIKTDGGGTLYAAAQYLTESDVGSNSVAALATGVDGEYAGMKIGGKVSSYNIYAAYSKTGTNTGTANGGIITPWGGMPAFTQGMVTRHMFLAGTEAWKLAGSYSWKEHGLNLKTVLYTASYDMENSNGYKPNQSWTAKESGFDFIFYPASVKNLQLRFRGNFPRDFAPNLDWNEYRLIANYNF